MEPNGYFTPCYHYQQGMTYPHNQDTCDHVPDIEGSSPFFSTNFQGYIYEPSYQELNPGQYYNHGVNPQTIPLREIYEPVPFSKKPNPRSKDISEPVKKIYEEISQECEHFLLRESCNQCQQQINSLPEIILDQPETAPDDEITQLALSMKRKREQNKKAAARYREKKKKIFTKALTEIEQLEQRQAELKSLIESYHKEILECRKTLGLPSC